MNQARRRLLQKHGMKDPRVKGLHEIVSLFNKDAGYVKFHVDHIVPLNMGGLHLIDNLWIVPADWNCETLIIRPPDMIEFIRKWIVENGRMCYKIPQELLDLEFAHIRRWALSVGFTERKI